MVDLNMKNLRKGLGRLDRDELLGYLGLETRRDTMDYLMPALGMFSVGVLVGAGLGLLFAPKPGSELRDDLRSRLARGEGGLPGEIPQVSAVGDQSARPV